MRPLSAFFKKFHQFAPPQRAIRRAAVTAISEVIGITLEEDQIEIVRSVVLLKTSSTIKSEILLHEQEVLAVMKKELAPAKQHINAIR